MISDFDAEEQGVPNGAIHSSSNLSFGGDFFLSKSKSLFFDGIFNWPRPNDTIVIPSRVHFQLGPLIRRMNIKKWILHFPIQDDF